MDTPQQRVQEFKEPETVWLRYVVRGKLLLDAYIKLSGGHVKSRQSWIYLASFIGLNLQKNVTKTYPGLDLVVKKYLIPVIHNN